MQEFLLSSFSENARRQPVNFYVGAAFFSVFQVRPKGIRACESYVGTIP
jgi:hypothetical protein